MKIFRIFLLCLVLPITAAGGEAEADFPQRIVSLGPITTENVYLLGAGDRLVGNTVYCTRPPEAREKMKVGTVMQASLEKIISLKPDLILSTGLTPPKLVKKLRDLGYRVVHFKQPNSFAEICSQFTELGQILGLEKKAASITTTLRKEVDQTARSANDLEKPKVLLQIGAAPLYVAGTDSFTSDYITLGGGVNAMGGRNSGRVNFEQVIAADPEVIIIAIMGSQTGVAAQEMKNWMRYRTIKAVRTGRIHVIDPDIVCSPSPATFLQALTIITRYLHPETGF